MLSPALTFRCWKPSSIRMILGGGSSCSSSLIPISLFSHTATSSSGIRCFISLGSSPISSTKAELCTGDIPSGLALIASAQYRNPVFAAQDACDGQHMQGLSGTSCTQIAYQNRRKIKLKTAAAIPVVEKLRKLLRPGRTARERVKEETHPTQLLKLMD